MLLTSYSGTLWWYSKKIQNWWNTRLFCTQIHSPARAHSTLCFMSTSLRTPLLKTFVGAQHPLRSFSCTTLVLQRLTLQVHNDSSVIHEEPLNNHTRRARYQWRAWPIRRLLPARIFSTSFTEELRGIFNPLCEWNNTGRKREWQGSTSSLVYNSKSIRKRPGREEPHDDHTVPQKVHYQTYCKRNQDAFFLDHSNQERRIKDCRSRIPATSRGSCAQTISPWSLPVLKVCRSRKQAAAKLHQPSVFQCLVLTSTTKLDALIMLEGWLAPGNWMLCLTENKSRQRFLAQCQEGEEIETQT